MQHIDDKFTFKENVVLLARFLYPFLFKCNFSEIGEIYSVTLSFLQSFKKDRAYIASQGNTFT